MPISNVIVNNGPIMEPILKLLAYWNVTSNPVMCQNVPSNPLLLVAVTKEEECFTHLN